MTKQAGRHDEPVPAADTTASLDMEQEEKRNQQSAYIETKHKPSIFNCLALFAQSAEIEHKTVTGCLPYHHEYK